MWLFTKYGFFSIVCARQGDGKQGQPIDTAPAHGARESARAP
jgi:hypothetical protein